MKPFTTQTFSYISLLPHWRYSLLKDYSQRELITNNYHSPFKTFTIYAMPQEIIKDEQEALKYLQWLQSTDVQKTTLTTELSHIEETSDEEARMLFENQRIIDKSNRILIDRLECDDASLSIKDIIQMKSEAFKNNQSIKGLWEDNTDYSKLIPTNINIQVINNN